MTSQSDAKPSPGAEEEESGGLLPAIIVGAGILIVAALLIFDFGGSDDSGDKSAAAAQGAKGGAAGSAAGGGKKGGVQSRPYDAAKGPAPSKVNPRLRMPSVGMNQAAAPPPEEIPDFASTAEEIAWHEKKLAGAIKVRDDRKKFVERLPKVKERIENGANPEEGLKAFDGRKKIVEDNYDRAVKKVEEIEAKLAELRGS
ncbi:MAG: hypothetical protein AAF721_10865 [Myxococcota bacterium]